jgi:hypothetical protein
VTHDDAVPSPNKVASTPTSAKAKKQAVATQPQPELEPLDVPKVTTPPQLSPKPATSPVPEGSVSGSMDSSVFSSSGSMAEDGTRKKKSKKTGKQTVAGKVPKPTKDPPPVVEAPVVLGLYVVVQTCCLRFIGEIERELGCFRVEQCFDVRVEPSPPAVDKPVVLPDLDIYRDRSAGASPVRTRQSSRRVSEVSSMMMTETTRSHSSGSQRGSARRMWLPSGQAKTLRDGYEYIP